MPSSRSSSPRSGRNRPRSTCPSCAQRSPSNPRFSDLEFAFDAGGMVRSAMNEGKSTPISIRVTGKDQKVAHQIATAIKNEVSKIDGVVDARIIQRLNYPQYVIKVDRAKAAELGLTQDDVMKNVVAAFNSSIQFNKHNFWIDPKSKNQYFVGVSVPREGHQVDRDAARHPDHQPGPETGRSRCGTS